jgi:predicted aldo/keto reductase-like oxidoreductase
MQYRRFGKTEMQLSVFSLGTMRYLESESNAIKTIAQALDVGINHLETARGYGKSEAFIGAAMRQGLRHRREQFYLTTKITPTPDAATMRQYIDESLQRMAVNYIDNFDVHGINTPEHLQELQKNDGYMAAIHQAVKEGKIRHVGFSTHGPVEVILEAIKTNLFASVNLHYYYFNQRNAAAVELAHQQDMGVFIISPSDKGGMLYQPSAQLSQLCEPFTPLYLNDRFLLADPRVHTLSLGAANPQEVLTHQVAWDQINPLTAAEKSVFARLETQMQTSLGNERCAQCYACLPCPEDINIPEALRLRNLAVAFDMVEFGKYRYKMFENAGHWFPGTKAIHCTDCGDCLPRCPEDLAIPDLLRDTHDRLHGTEGKRLWD